MSDSTCQIDGCHARVHGRGLCRIHFDHARYLETTGRSPEAAAAEREQRLNGELRLNCVDDAEHRAAWEERLEQLLEEHLTPPHRPGRRPSAWWAFDAGRPEHLSDYPPSRGGTIEEQAEALDAYELEPITWMAAHGHLTDPEIEDLRDRAEVARARVGTDDERIGAGGVDRADQRAVELWEAVEKALGEESG
jgi:hypothetical protein